MRNLDTVSPPPMPWYVRQTLGLLCLVALPLGPVLAIVAIWTSSDKIGGTAAVLIVSGVISGIAYGVWGVDGGAPARPMSRASRKELRLEQERIEREHVIKRLEHENGIGEH